MIKYSSKKALWISSDSALGGTVKEEFELVAKGVIGFYDNIQLSPPSGVYFTTYNGLVNQNYLQAFKIVRWLGADFDGVVSKYFLLVIEFDII